MEENIKILEEIVDIYYDCAGNKEQDYDMRVDMGFMKKEAQALENLIKGYRELEKENKKLNIATEYFVQTNRTLSRANENSIPKSLIKKKIEELENKPVCLCTRSNGKNDVALQNFINNTVMKVLHELMEEE